MRLRLRKAALHVDLADPGPEREQRRPVASGGAGSEGLGAAQTDHQLEHVHRGASWAAGVTYSFPLDSRIRSGHHPQQIEPHRIPELVRGITILADHYHLLLKTSDVAPIHKLVKRLHGDSAIQLNKLDNTPGRQVWYQYWDRFPRNEPDFWAYFNYIHINPLKHGYVRLSDSILLVEGKQVKIASGHALDVHQCLAHYPHSGYHYYVREYGEEFLTDAWMAGCVIRSRIILNTITFDSIMPDSWTDPGVPNLFGFVAPHPQQLGESKILGDSDALGQLSISAPYPGGYGKPPYF